MQSSADISLSIYITQNKHIYRNLLSVHKTAIPVPNDNFGLIVSIKAVAFYLFCLL